MHWQRALIMSASAVLSALATGPALAGPARDRFHLGEGNAGPWPGASE